MPSYISLLYDVAELAETRAMTAATPRLLSLEEKIQAGFLAMLNIYVSSWLWNREFAAELRPLLTRSSLTDLISYLVSKSTLPRRANGDYENLITAVYVYLMQRNKTEWCKLMGKIQVQVMIGRDGNLLCLSLENFIIEDPVQKWKLPQKKYELYLLHAHSLLASEHNPYDRVKRILRAYAYSWSRTHHRKINELLASSTSLESLITSISTWINSPAEFPGFTPDGDFAHSVTAIYLVLKNHELQNRFDSISLYLDDGRLRTLKERFPSAPERVVSVASAFSTTSSDAAAIEGAISPTSAARLAAPAAPNRVPLA